MEAVLGAPEDVHARGDDSATMYFHEANVQVTLHQGGVHFIEIAAHPHQEGLDVALGDTVLSRLETEDCIDHLRAANGDAGIHEDEDPSSYVFNGVGISVWQSASLQDALGELDDAKSRGDEEEIAMIEEDVEAARYFEAIGIGSPEYISQNYGD